MANDFNKLVRARMTKTGESFSIARMHLLAERRASAPPPTSSATSSPPATVSPWSIWEFDSQDITWDVQVALYDDLVECVQSSGEYPVGYTEFDELMFRNIDREEGTAEFRVLFSAEHWSEDYTFNGHVTGVMRFDPEAQTKKEFLESLEVAPGAQEHFNMD